MSTSIQEQIPDKLTSLFSLKSLLWLAIVIGIFLRLEQYLLNRSLWIDEAFLALNIINRSYLEFLEPLDYNQGAPVGFLVLEKIAVQIFGNSEYSLRLVPFIAGIASIFLFYQVAKRISRLPAIVIALGLFALCDRLIYYSAEVKQYSSDVAIALLILLLAVRLNTQITYTESIIFAAFGGVAIWFSHPCVFVLAGTGSYLFVSSLIEQQWKNIFRYLIMFGTWAASFTAFYFISIRPLSNNEALQKSWEESHNSFVPFPPVSLTDFRWFFDKFFEIFDYPAGIHLTGIAALAFIVGCASLFASNSKNLYLLISPIFLALIASGLHQYPFKGQLLLFIIPSILLIIAEGTIAILKVTRSNRLIGITVVALLFAYPLYYAASNIKDPNSFSQVEYQRVREDIKPVLNYVEEHLQAEDTIYLYYASQYAFKYYSNRYSFDYSQEKAMLSEPNSKWFTPALSSFPPKLIVGDYARENWEVFEKDLDHLRGDERVWIVFSHAYDRRSSLSEEDVFVYLLDRIGTQLDSFSSTEASAYLYNLS